MPGGRASYDRHAEMQRLMAQGLVAAVGGSLARAGRILEIGCGTGYLTGLLRQANPAAQLVALDLDAALVAAARRRLGPGAGVAWLVADGETSIRGTYDLIIANATFQWFTRPGETLAAYYRSLAPGGVLAFSTLGPQTFQELAESLDRAARGLDLAGTPPIPAQGFGDRETWSHRLYGAGFPQARLAREMVTATFPSVKEFLKALQATGATSPRPYPFSSRSCCGPHRGVSDRLRQRRRHPGELRNYLGRGAKRLRRFFVGGEARYLFVVSSPPPQKKKDKLLA